MKIKFKNSTISANKRIRLIPKSSDATFISSPDFINIGDGSYGACVKPALTMFTYKQPLPQQSPVWIEVYFDPAYPDSAVTVNWGNGETDVITPTDPTVENNHGYLQQIYTVAEEQFITLHVSGRISHVVLGDIHRIVDWGIPNNFAIQTNSLNLYEVPTTLSPYINTLYGFFFNARSFNQNIDTWDTSNVVDMANMFSYATNFNQPLNSWNTAKVTDMSGMFKMAQVFNQDISGWNTSSVTSFKHMFAYATAYNSPLEAWNTELAVDMSHMFLKASAFNQPLGYWNVCNVENMDGMFQEATVFNQNLRPWCVAKVLSKPASFNISSQQPANREPLWGTCAVYSKEGSAFRFTVRGTNITEPFQFKWWYGDFNSEEPSQDYCTFFINGEYYSSQMYGNDSIMIEPGQEYHFEIYGNVKYFDWYCDTDIVWPGNEDMTPYVPADLGELIVTEWPAAGNAYRLLLETSTTKLTVPNYAPSMTDFNNLFLNSANFNQDLSMWDVSHVTNMDSMFSHCIAFNGNITTWNTANVTDMSDMFSHCYSFNQDISNWDTSKVTKMDAMFVYARFFNQPIGKWNVSNVANMQMMFWSAFSFDQDLSTWNTSNVTDMMMMFSDTRTFNHDISMWNVANVTNMNGMFWDAIAFNQPLDTWVFHSGLKDMSGMFRGAKLFNQPLNNWDVSNVEDMSAMFRDAIAFNQPLNEWDTSSVKEIGGMFYGATAYTYDFRAWNTASIIPSEITEFAPHIPESKHPLWGLGSNSGGGDDGGDSLPLTNLLPFEATVSPVGYGITNGVRVILNSKFPAMRGYIDWGDGTTSTWRVSTGSTSTNDSAYTRLDHDYADKAQNYRIKIYTSTKLSYLRVTNIIEVHDWGAAAIERFLIGYSTDQFHSNMENQSRLIAVPNYLPSYVISTESMFKNANNFNDPNVVNWDMSNVVRMSAMFEYCSIFNQPIGSWNVSNSIQIDWIFRDCIAFNQSVNAWNTSKVAAFDGAFSGCTVFNQPLNNWDTHLADEFRNMFDGCINFNQNINSWNTANVWNFSQMFQNCAAFDQPLDQWNMVNAYDMSDMFNGCTLFNQPVGNWNTSKVQTIHSIFKDCVNFNQSVNGWDVSKVGMATAAFWGAIAFNQPLDQWNTANFVNTDRMFQDAAVFNQDINVWNVGKVSSMHYMFAGAIAFNKPLGDWYVVNVTYFNNMFNGAISFSQDLTKWCVPYRSGLPEGFNDGSALTNEQLPVWGTCPLQEREYV